MYRSQFIQFVTVASWLWLSSGNLARSVPIALATEPTPSCQIVTFRGGELMQNSLPPTRVSGILDLAIVCQGNALGNLSVTLEPIVVHNGIGSMRFVNSSGLLAGANPNPTSTIITIPISSQGDGRGNARLMVEIVGQEGKLLRSGSDYRLSISAALEIAPSSRK
ncbi:hypothetical protein [Chamaesiphon polymorphus]|uniref:Uncharacterized protein n=1 Tax=Chamaesiphon polymorphus CCALA 037 TaxID=2107692 RepID=A0A2T1GGY3_9CYAN|nr:hypothetical protein [Chamaesiphon polymorphus]PSB56916.1 hypothetical protein C7B77_10230 [Chamaesiphon polymorphus CCALA 037]